MRKEKVVVFDGEDKFIAPKNTIYKKETGEASLVGEGQPESFQSPATTVEGEAFKAYMRKLDEPVLMPSPLQSDFCSRIQEFIKTSGDGKASPEQIMEAYKLFQDNCVEKPKENPVVTDSPPPVEAQVEKEQPKEQVKQAIPKLNEMTTSFVPLSTPTLGKPLSGSSGGVEEKKDEPKKSSNWLIWVLIGGAAIYLLTRKKN